MIPPAAIRPGWCVWLPALLGLAWLCGCAPYRVGVDSLYRSDIRTVYVPMIESSTYRRDLGERLTEAVVKEIESRTIYKVVSTPNADSVLTCRVIDAQKYLTIESPTDEGRELRYQWTVEANWVQRGELIAQTQVPIEPDAVRINTRANFVPEYGQSNATAQQQSINKIAARIVDLMEVQWAGGDEPRF